MCQRKMMSRTDSQIMYGDSNFELVLPSGAHIGHRSMRRYYEQSVPTSRAADDPKSGTAIVWWLLADKRDRKSVV